MAAGLGLVGCIDDARPGAGAPSDPPTDSPSVNADLPADLRLVDGTPTVAFPDVADGEVSVSGTLQIEYDSPVPAIFGPAAVYRGREVENEAGNDTLRVSLSLPSGGPPTAAVVPVYGTDTGFEYRVYANGAFVSMHDWQISAGTGNLFDGGDGVGRRAASFAPHYRHVHRDVVTPALVPSAAPDDPLSVGLFQYTYGELSSRRPGDLTGVMVFGQRGARQTPVRAPQISFTFDHDGQAGTVTVVHDGGDAVAAAALLVRVDGTPTDTQFGDRYEEVAAGDRVTVDVSDASAGAPLRVIWESDDGRSAATLGKFRLP